MPEIKHVWFDLVGTLTIHTPEHQERHDDLVYKTYSAVRGKPVSDDLKAEYGKLYRECGTHSFVFRKLGMSPDYWQNIVRELNEEQSIVSDERIWQTLQRLKDMLAISLFSNVNAERIPWFLHAISVEPTWFTHLMSASDIGEPKPALPGFYRMVELSGLPPENLLYVGDRIKADILPAKKVGMQTCLMWSSSPEADFSCESFEEILRIVHR